MDTFVLVIHLIVSAALIILVLLQRSEGAGLAGPSSSGMMPIRGSGNPLSRATSIFATIFFITSTWLAVLAGSGHRAGSIVDDIANTPPAKEAPAVPAKPAAPAAPVSE